jgi:hypothetical protein
MKLIEWERDRVMSAAKGIGATAGAFLAGLITALLSAEIKAEVPQSAVLGCLLGAVGALFIAVDLAKSTQGFVEGAVP